MVEYADSHEFRYTLVRLYTGPGGAENAGVENMGVENVVPDDRGGKRGSGICFGRNARGVTSDNVRVVRIARDSCSSH